MATPTFPEGHAPACCCSLCQRVSDEINDRAMIDAALAIFRHPERYSLEQILDACHAFNRASVRRMRRKLRRRAAS